MNKLQILIGSLFIIFISSLLVFGYYWTEGYGFTETDVTGETIEEALFKATQKKHLKSYGKIVEEIYINEDTRLIFHLDENQLYIYTSVVKQKWNGKWKVVSISGNVEIERNPAELHPYIYSGLGFHEESPISGHWGVIYNDNVTSMVVKKNKEISEAEIIELPRLPRIWFKYYNAADPYIRYITFWPEDAKGNKVPWSPIEEKEE